MQSIFETMPQLVQYQTALLMLATLCLIVMLQSFLSAPLAFLNNKQVPGVTPKGEHAELSFRVLRTYANSVENFPAFGWSLLLAIVMGVGPELVNGLAVTYMAFRVAYWAVYYAGVGQPAGGPRTLCYVGAMFANMALSITAFIALIS